MASPINVKEKARIWDIMRQRFKLPMKSITSKADLNKRISKLAKTNKNAKQLKRLVAKTDFWDFAKTKAVERQGVRSYVRNAKPVIGYTKSAPRRWTNTELNKVISWKASGKSSKQIARWTKRSQSSVSTKLSRMRK